MTLKKDNQDILRDLSEAGFNKLAQDCKSFSERAQDLAEKYKDQKILEGNLLPSTSDGTPKLLVCQQGTNVWPHTIRRYSTQLEA